MAASLAPSASASLELRLALFVEGADALAAILGRHHTIIGFDLEHHAAGKIHLQPEMNRVLRLAHGDRGVFGNAPPGLDRLVAQRTQCTDAVDHAPCERLTGAERAAGEDKLLGPPLADSARQGLRAGGAGHDAEGYFREREPRRLGGVGEVAAE